jgi:SAM-dependent methyltransferase
MSEVRFDQQLASSPAQNAEETKHRLCPVCSSDSRKLLFQQSFRALDRIGLLNGYDVVVCQDCGMTYADHIPSQSAFDGYYRGLSKYAYEHRAGQESPEDSCRLRQVANVIRSFVPNRDTRILEVGCATGRLLGFLKQFGYNNVFGLDPAPDCAKLARDLYGVEVFTGSIFNAPVQEHSYEFVISLQVLEHIRELDQALTALRRLISADGLLYVDVPDATKYVPEREAPFQEFSTEHINFFSPTTLQYLMEGASFRTIEAKSASVRDLAGKPVPIAYGVFQNGGPKRTEFPRHFEAEEGVRRYVASCSEMDTSLRRRIDEAVTGHRSLIVWGVGTHTQRLLATGALKPANIAAFVDSNPKYQNQQLEGIPIVRPDGLRGRSEPILISSCGFQKEISTQIRQMGLPNELILLYAEPVAAG